MGLRGRAGVRIGRLQGGLLHRLLRRGLASGRGLLLQLQLGGLRSGAAIRLRGLGRLDRYGGSHCVCWRGDGSEGWRHIAGCEGGLIDILVEKPGVCVWLFPESCGRQWLWLAGDVTSGLTPA